MSTTNIPCCYVVLRKGNKALFVLRTKTGFQDGKYGFPAGHVEPGESFRNAVIREAKEEVGVIINPKDLNHIHTVHRYQTPDNIRVDVVFEATKWTGTPKNIEKEKHGKIEWLDLNKLPDNVQDFTADAIKHFMKNKTYSEHGWSDSS